MSNNLFPPENSLRVLLRLDLLFFGLSKWTEGIFRVRVDSRVVDEIQLSKWNFESPTGSFEESYLLKNYEVELFNSKQLTQSSPAYSVSFEQFSLNPDSMSYFQIKSPTIITMKCLPGCKKCSSPLSCDECEESKAFFQSKLLCQKPYEELKPGTNVDVV